MFRTEIVVLLCLGLCCHSTSSNATVSLNCDAERAQIVVDITSTTTIMHIPCEIKSIDGQKVGGGAFFDDEPGPP